MAGLAISVSSQAVNADAPMGPRVDKWVRGRWLGLVLHATVSESAWEPSLRIPRVARSVRIFYCYAGRARGRWAISRAPRCPGSAHGRHQAFDIEPAHRLAGNSRL